MTFRGPAVGRIDCLLPAAQSRANAGDSLTPREREVMAFLVKGLLNKQVGAELGMTLPTVKFHRAHVMQKMKAGSIADLVRISERLEAHSDEWCSTSTGKRSTHTDQGRT